MALTPLITAADLRNALGLNTYMALYDEDTDGSGQPTGDIATVDALASVALTLKRAHMRVISRLPAIYNKIPDGTDSQVSELLRDAEIEFAIGMSYDRHPEYVQRFGMDTKRKGAYQTAMETMDLIQDAVLRIVPNDAPPEAAPRNVGGVVVDSGNRVFLPNPDGSGGTGDW